MGYIYTVSPEYLETIYNKCQVFQYINIIGYRDINKATRRLHFTNVKDVLGYMYVGDYMPEYSEMMRFIRKIELTLNKNKMLLLVIRDENSYLDFINQYSGSHVQIRAIAGFEVLNDMILRNAIGTIYQTQAEPYLELVNKKDNDVVIGNKYINFERLMPKELTALVTPVRKLNTLDETIRFDNVLMKMRDKTSFEYQYRQEFIKSSFGKKVKMPEGSSYDYITTEALKQILKEGDINAR